MEIIWTEPAAKDLRRLDRQLQLRILAVIDRFILHGLGDARALHGRERGLFRLRIGAWRVVMSRETPDRLVICRIRPRGQVYRR